MPARRPATEAARRILDVAERLAQMRGFNGFSYADIATELDVTKASLHYHFPSKAILGRALIARYHDAFARRLGEIDAEAIGAPVKLARYAGLYRGVLSDDRMCLCGMVAAEYTTLPRPMQGEIRRFFSTNEVWLAAVLAQGERAGELRLRGPSLEIARLVLSTLQGAMLVARSYRSVARFDNSANALLADLGVEPRSAAGPRPHTGTLTRSKATPRPAAPSTIDAPRPKLPRRARVP